MFKHLQFTLFVLIWGIAFWLPEGRQWGGGWLLFGVVLLFLKYRFRKADCRGETFSAGLFDLPRLHYSGEALVFSPEAGAEAEALFTRIVPTASRTARGETRWASLGVVCCIVAFFVGRYAFIPGGLAVFLCAVHLFRLIPVPGGIRRLERFRIAVREAELQRHSRPPFDPEDEQNRNFLARHYRDPLQARTALVLMRKFGINFIVYPEDDLLLAIGSGKLPALFRFLTDRELTPRFETFGELVLRLTWGEELSNFSEVNPAVHPPPPWPEALGEMVAYRDGKPKPIEDSEANAFLCGKPIGREAPRPLYSPALFFSYWPTRREAEVAWVVRRLIIDVMGRPGKMMVYPNDPMNLLDCWAGDSLESVEFILALEEHFGIKIPDADAERLFTTLSFSDTVHYLIEKIDAGATGNNAFQDELVERQ